MKIARSPRFVRDFEALPEEIRKRAKAKLALFLENPRHPSLRIRKMEGCEEIWEGRISREYRFTFEISGDLYRLRRIGTHDILRNP